MTDTIRKLILKKQNEAKSAMALYRSLKKEIGDLKARLDKEKAIESVAWIKDVPEPFQDIVRVASLTQRECEAVIKHCFEGYRKCDLAKVWGVSPRRAGKVCDHAMRKCRSAGLEQCMPMADYLR